MQSGDDWDEDWDDDDSGSAFVSDMSAASKMKIAGAAAFVFVILICAMVFQNCGSNYLHKNILKK